MSLNIHSDSLVVEHKFSIGCLESIIVDELEALHKAIESLAGGGEFRLEPQSEPIATAGLLLNAKGGKCALGSVSTRNGSLGIVEFAI